MPRKSRTSRAKRMVRANGKTLAVKAVSQGKQATTSPPAPSKQASLAKLTVTMAGQAEHHQAEHHQYVLAELRRSLTITAVIIVFLIAL